MNAPPEYWCRTAVGIFWIRPQPGYPDRVWLGIDEVGPLGSYHSPEAAADDFAGGHTGWHEWDSIAHTSLGPRDLSEWHRRRSE